MVPMRQNYLHGDGDKLHCFFLKTLSRRAFRYFFCMAHPLNSSRHFNHDGRPFLDSRVPGFGSRSEDSSFQGQRIGGVAEVAELQACSGVFMLSQHRADIAPSMLSWGRLLNTLQDRGPSKTFELLIVCRALWSWILQFWHCISGVLTPSKRLLCERSLPADKPEP